MSWKSKQWKWNTVYKYELQNRTLFQCFHLSPSPEVTQMQRKHSSICRNLGSPLHSCKGSANLQSLKGNSKFPHSTKHSLHKRTLFQYWQLNPLSLFLLVVLYYINGLQFNAVLFIPCLFYYSKKMPLITPQITSLYIPLV